MVNLDELRDFLNSLTFRNNPQLRPAGAQLSYTKEMVQEWIKCRDDPIYFIEHYVHVVHPDRGVVLMKLHEYQKRMILAYHENRRVIGMTARQMGKCLSINTKVKIKNKSTQEIVEVTLGEFYEWQKFREYATDENLQLLLQTTQS